MTAEEEREICARIKQARKQRGLTQEEFADLLSVERRTVQNYEHDRVPWRLLGKIAKLTGVTQDWLLRGDVHDTTQLDRIEDKLDALIAMFTVDAAVPAEEQPEGARAASTRGTNTAAGGGRR